MLSIFSCVFWPSVCLWRNGEVLRFKVLREMKDWNWGDDGPCGDGLTPGLTVWTTFHLEAESDRDLRHDGTQGGQDGWSLGHGPGLPRSQMRESPDGRYLSLGRFRLLAVHGFAGCRGGGGSLLAVGRPDVCLEPPLLLRPPLPVRPQLCGLPAALSADS